MFLKLLQDVSKLSFYLPNYSINNGSIKKDNNKKIQIDNLILTKTKYVVPKKNSLNLKNVCNSNHNKSKLMIGFQNNKHGVT